jgi:sortase (surface protein transpeptidase)
MSNTQPSLGRKTAFQKVYSRKWSFLALFLIVLFGTVSICMATGFIPDSTSANTVSLSGSSTDPFAGVSSSSLLASAASAAPLVASSNTDTGTASNVSGALNMSGDLPVKIVIPSIKVSATVANPDTTNVDALDSYLSYGAARYPTSATLDQQGNVIIFGHSSYLPVIINQHYKTFDGIQNLKPGDESTVYSATKEYVYSVQTENEESATSDFQIPLTTTGHTLTLSTCDSFAQKTDRFIVTATLVGSYALGS